ncbi:unnamed protein product [Discosporangium mesarthrocarpum]
MGPWDGGGVGEYVPHLVLVSLHKKDWDMKEARVLGATAFERSRAKEVTSIKLSPLAGFILLGCGVKGRVHRTLSSLRNQPVHHPVTSIYRASDMHLEDMVLTAEDDVNIACFHPEPGMGCVYGTKRGRVCVARMAGLGRPQDRGRGDGMNSR